MVATVTGTDLSRVWLSETPWTVALPAPLVCGISQTGILDGVAIPFSRGSSLPRDQTYVSFIVGGFFTIGATWETHYYD